MAMFVSRLVHWDTEDAISVLTGPTAHPLAALVVRVLETRPPKKCSNKAQSWGRFSLLGGRVEVSRHLCIRWV